MTHSELELHEKLVQKFLRENDAEYFHKTGYKSNMIEYPYHSAKQQRDIDSNEIPLSNLSNNQRMQSPKFGDSHEYEEAN